MKFTAYNGLVSDWGYQFALFTAVRYVVVIGGVAVASLSTSCCKYSHIPTESSMVLITPNDDFVLLTTFRGAVGLRCLRRRLIVDFLF